MRLDIRLTQQAPQLTNLVATAGIGSVALTWDAPISPYHKYTEVWVGSDENGSNAQRIGNTNDFAYVVVDASPDTVMYYWVRSVSIYGVPGLISNRAAKAGDSVTGTSAKGLSVGASSQIFAITKAGATSPSQISLFASAQNLQGDPTWSVIAGDATLTPAGNPYQQTLTFANMRSDLVTVQIAQDDLVDQISIVKVKDGVDSVTGMLTNEAANIAADSAGNVTGSYSNCGGNFKVYNGTLDVSASASYSVPSQNGVTVKIDPSGAYTVSGVIADTASATLRAAFNGLNIDKVYTISKVKQGTKGPDGSGSPGTRGTVTIAVSTTLTTWPATDSSGTGDSKATTAFFNSYGQYPINRDIMTLYNTSAKFSETRFYSGGSWLALTSYINGNMLVAGTLSCASLVADTLTGQTYQTAPSGTRIVINASGAANKVQWYNGSSLSAEIGGTSGVIYGTSGSSFFSTIAGFATGPLAGVVGQTSGSGTGVTASGVSGSNAALYATNSSGVAIRFNGGITCTAFPAAASTSSVAYFNNIAPVSANTYYCGLYSAPWAGIISQTSVAVTSDRRYKKDIVDSDLGLDFISQLRPVSYSLVERQKDVIEGEEPMGPWLPGQPVPEVERTFISLPGVRRHYGLIAQEVKEVLGDKDAAFWAISDMNDPDSRQTLRYEELIGPMIKAIQELKAMVETQAAVIQELQGKVTS